MTDSLVLEIVRFIHIRIEPLKKKIGPLKSIVFHTCFQGVHWEHVNSPQALLAISTCNTIIWTVGRKGELYYIDGITDEIPAGSNWKLIEAPKCGFTYGQKSTFGAKAVSLTQSVAWVLLTTGTIAARTGITRDRQDGVQWKYLSGNYKYYKSF